MDHTWPENLSELQTAIKTFVAIGDQSISLAATQGGGFVGEVEWAPQAPSLKEAARAASTQIERQLISEVLVATGGNRKRAADELGISYKALLYKLKQVGAEDQPASEQERSRTMKPANLLVLALILASLFCLAQDQSAAQIHSRPRRPPPSAPARCSSRGIVRHLCHWPVRCAYGNCVEGADPFGQHLVRPDGMISLALLGDVQASGMTPLQLADQITTKLKKYIQDPNVSVVISQIHSKVVYLLGEVGKKGPVE